MNLPEVSALLFANWSDPCEQVPTRSVISTSDVGLARRTQTLAATEPITTQAVHLGFLLCI